MLMFMPLVLPLHVAEVLPSMSSVKPDMVLDVLVVLPGVSGAKLMLPDIVSGVVVMSIAVQ